MYSNPWLTLSYGSNALNYASPLNRPTLVHPPPPAHHGHGHGQIQHGGVQVQPPASSSSSVIVPTSTDSTGGSSGVPPGSTTTNSESLLEQWNGNGFTSGSGTSGSRPVHHRNPNRNSLPNISGVPSSSQNQAYPPSVSESYDGIPHSKQRELLESLECPVCKDISPPPILNCSNGHIICKACRQRLPNCPICQAGFIDTRNLSVEFISSLVQLKCTHSNCNQVIAGDKYKDHLDNCGLRPINCYCHDVQPCSGKEIEFNSYERHLKEVHKLVGFEPRQDLPFYEFVQKVLDFSLKSSFLYYIKHSGKLFLLNVMIHKSNMYSWVSIVESEPNPPASYEASLTYYVKESQNKARCAWKIPIHSFRKSFDELEQLGDLAAIPSSILMSLCGYSTVSLQRKRKILSYEWRVTVRIERGS